MLYFGHLICTDWTPPAGGRLLTAERSSLTQPCVTLELHRPRACKVACTWPVVAGLGVALDR